MPELRIFGPPGCGKTTYLCKSVRQAAEDYGPESLLLASFTKTAATELAGRGLPIDEYRIGTLHAHCFRMLGSPTIAESKVKEFNEENGTYKLSPGGNAGALDESAMDMVCNTDHDAILAEYQIMRAQMIPRDRWSMGVRGFASKWESWKSGCGYMDFTDLIENVSAITTAPPYNATIGIFDEVQDFTPLQLDLIRKWGKHLDYFLLAGDDDQTLYTFTGATPDAFLKPEVGDDQKVILDQSYRVPRAPQAFAQKLISRITNRQEKVYKPRAVDGEVRACRATFKQPQDLIEEINRYKGEGKTIMVLGACGYMLQPLANLMRERGLTFHNPYRVNRGDWNPLKSTEGSTKNRVLQFLFPEGPPWKQFKWWTPHQLALWLDVVAVKGLLKSGGKTRLVNYAAKQDWNKIEFGQLMKDCFEPEPFRKALNLSTDFLLEHAATSRRKQLDYIHNIVSKSGPGELQKTPSVCLGTIHSVKGGEADVVFLFPDLSMNGQKAYATSFGEGWESVIRQFYVGATRCKETLVICAPSSSWFVREIII